MSTLSYCEEADVVTLLKLAENRAKNVFDNDSLTFLHNISTAALESAARRVTKKYASQAFNFCSIVNAKSGRCSQDCAWCAQSRHFTTSAPNYPLMDSDKILHHARAVEAAGVGRFSIVTSGRKLSRNEVKKVADIVRRLRAETGLEICLSAGLLSRDELKILFEAGVARCHCNLETAPSFFPTLCSTHSTQDKIATIQSARAVGMQVCSGGIIGMGETEIDRIELADTLSRLEIPSIPINILSPIAGTRLEKQPLIRDEEIVRSVSIFRILNPRAYLRFAGGRARLSDETQKRCLAAGINSAITGDMLTTSGNAVAHDRELLSEVGYEDERTDTLEFDRRHLWHPYAGTLNPPVLNRVVGAQGVRIELSDGRVLIDGTSSWWCALFGYGRPELIAAIQKQAETLSHVMFGGLTHDAAADLGRRILKFTPPGLKRIFYADSGSVAVEIAMKMALQYQASLGLADKTEFLTLRHGYHGDTWNAMSVCDPVDGMHRLFGSALSTRRIYIESPSTEFGEEFNCRDLDELKRTLEEDSGKIAAFILEPVVQGASAMRFYHPQYLFEAKRLCEKYGVLLIADEIATGFGRTGRHFACNWANITPDIMTIGKALTGGMMTLSAVLTTQSVADVISSHAPFALMHGPTYMANPLACRTACAALDLYEKLKCEESARRIEKRLRPGLEVFKSHPLVKSVRVLGAIAAVECRQLLDVRRLQPAFVDAGVWVRPFGNIAYLMPPLVIEDCDLDLLIAGFTTVLKDYLDNCLAKESS